MDVNAEVFFNQEEVPVIILKEFEMDTYVEGHHVYKDTWNPEIGESLDAQIKPNKSVDKYTAFIRKSGKIAGHLKKEATGRFAKTIFFFLKGDAYSKAKTIISGRRFNLGDGESLQVTCKVKLVGQGKFINLLQDELISLMTSPLVRI